MAVTRLYFDDWQMYNAWPEQSRVECQPWADRMAPDHWIVSIEIVTEGRVRLLAIRKNRPGLCDDIWHSGECPHCADVGIILRAIYVDALPPHPILRAMAAAA